MMSWFIFTCHFFRIVWKHIKQRPHPKRIIHELWEEVMNFNQLTTSDLDVPLEIFEPCDDWEYKWKTTTGMCSPFLCILYERFLSLWSSIIPN